MRQLLAARNFMRITFAALILITVSACGDSGSTTTSDNTQTAQSTAVEQASSGYTRINQANENDPLDAAIFELDNGLKVYLTENHEEPRFYAEIAVRAGSKHDPADATGLAHYLEHLLFKGTSQLGTVDYEAEKPYLDRIVELYEQHFNETDEAVRAEIYAEINRNAQLAAQYDIPTELDK